MTDVLGVAEKVSEAERLLVAVWWVVGDMRAVVDLIHVARSVRVVGGGPVAVGLFGG